MIRYFPIVFLTACGAFPPGASINAPGIGISTPEAVPDVQDGGCFINGRVVLGRGSSFDCGDTVSPVPGSRPFILDEVSTNAVGDSFSELSEKESPYDNAVNHAYETAMNLVVESGGEWENIVNDRRNALMDICFWSSCEELDALWSAVGTTDWETAANIALEAQAEGDMGRINSDQIKAISRALETGAWPFP